MKKVVLLVMCILFAAAASGDDTVVTVNIPNQLPVVEILEPSDVFKNGSTTVVINTTVSDNNSLRQIVSVTATITGPSVIEESPVLLSTVDANNSVQGNYEGSFTLDEFDDVGIYTVSVTVNDSVNVSFNQSNFSYIQPVSVVTVCSSGCDYTQIQDAVDGEIDGSTIQVLPGTYEEFDVLNRDSLTIYGTDKNTVIVDSDQTATPVVVKNTTNSLIKNLTVTDGFQGFFISNDSMFNEFTDLTILNSLNFGLLVLSGSEHNTFFNIEIESTQTFSGVLLSFADSNNLNTIHSHNNQENGLFVIDSVNLTVINSNFSDNLLHGISLLRSNSSIYDDNIANTNNGSGVYFDFGYFNIFNNLNSSFNDEGVYFRFSFNNSIENSYLYGNLVGLFVSAQQSEDNSITNSIIFENFIGIDTVANSSNDKTIISGNTYRNVDCDIDHGDPLNNICEFDFTPPAQITDLIATTSGNSQEIEVEWTAVGDNHIYGTASSYDLRYHTEEINESNWDNATSVSVVSPAANGTLESQIVSLPSTGLFYFAVRAIDNVGLEGDISNSPFALSVFHDIVTNSIDCVNGRSGFLCNHTTSGSTNYLYDQINVTGEIQNKGSANENATVELEARIFSFNTVNTSIEFIEENTTKEVEMFWTLQGIPDNFPFDIGLKANSSRKTIGGDSKAWSIANNIETRWFSETQFPSSIEAADSDIHIAIEFRNNNIFQTFYDYPLHLAINDTFSIVDRTSGSIVFCTNDNTSCFYDIALQSSFQFFFWTINDLQSGTYNISVIQGINDLDRPPVLTKIVSVQ